MTLVSEARLSKKHIVIHLGFDHDGDYTSLATYFLTREEALALSIQLKKALSDA